MTDTMLMKAGEFKEEKKMQGKLFQNIIKTKTMEANITHLLPGTKTQKYTHKGGEIHYMIEGEVEFKVGDEKYILQAGDILFHSSNKPLRSKNLSSSRSAKYITVSTPPTFM